jgi:hypothetical protein
MPVDLRDLFLHLQNELAALLEGNQAALKHPSALGSATEDGWRQMLATYLPKRYCVSKAFIVDSEGGQSDEIDLVIYDQQYSPFLFKRENAIFIPAESVYAVFEVKQRLNASTVRYASQKAASVRKLLRTCVKVTHAGGEHDPRPPFPLLSGLLCLQSAWKPPLGRKLAEGLVKSSQQGRLDLLCALKHGAVEVAYGKKGQVSLDSSAPDAALIFFFLRLLERLQGLGTVPAIDLRAYGRSLTS